MGDNYFHPHTAAFFPLLLFTGNAAATATGELRRSRRVPSPPPPFPPFPRAAAFNFQSAAIAWCGLKRRGAARPADASADVNGILIMLRATSETNPQRQLLFGARRLLVISGLEHSRKRMAPIVVTSLRKARRGEA